MIKKILNAQSKTITFSAALIAFSVGVSALLGLLRDRLLAGTFGAGPDLDVYFAAFRIPDLVYGILITGGIVAAFLPVFAESLEKDKKEGWKLVNNTINTLFIVLVLLGFVLLIFAPYIVKLIAPGFTVDQREITTLMTRIMMISPILLGVSSLFSGVLQYFNRFLIYSLAPILYNLGIIFAIIFLVPIEGVGIIGLAYGVIIGSLLHLVIQIVPSFMCGYSYKPVIDIRQKELLKIFKLMVPRIIGQASSQINLIVITAIASTLTAGSIAIFNFADHLQAFPVRIIGVAFAVAAFPAFSKSFALKNKEKFLRNFNTVIRQVLFLIIPMSILVFVLRAQIVRLVLGTGEFGWIETRLTVASLGIFAVGLFAYAIIHILVRAFFSFQDTKTPLYASLVSMSLNIILSFLFVWILDGNNLFRSLAVALLKLDALSDIRVIAFPLALLFSGVVHFIFLLYFLRKKIGSLDGGKILDSSFIIIIASFIMGIAAFITIHIVDYFFYLETFKGRFFQSFAAFVVSVLVYILVSKLMKSPELSGFRQSFTEK